MLPSQITIIGAGRIGQMFASIQEKTKETTITLLHRAQTQIASEGPILICTRNDDLQAIIDFIPTERHGDLIFIQNGMLQTWFKNNQLQEATQALLYVAVSKVGDQPIDGKRSVVTGKYAGFICQLMEGLGLVCTEVSQEEFTKEMVEKFLWNCCFGLLSQHFKLSVGEVIKEHENLVRDLILEQLTVCENSLEMILATSDKEAMIKRLFDYSFSIFDYRGAVKEWSWRNGWLVNQPSHPKAIHHDLLLQTVPSLYSAK